MLKIVLLLIGGLIIALLSGYALYLGLQIKKQRRLEQQAMAVAVTKRNANIFLNVDTLCLVGIQGQCDLSELSIRIYCILDYIQGEQRIDVAAEYPAISALYHEVKDMARGDARKALSKQERKQQAEQREEAEGRLNDSFVAELKLLQQKIQQLSVAPADTM